jgi:hypothetical protein
MSKPRKPSVREQMKKMKAMLASIDQRKKERKKKKGVAYLFSCSAGDRS